MKEWVFIIFTVSLAGGIINLLAAGGAGEKHIKLLCGIICVYVTVIPIKQLIKGFEIKNPEEISKTISLPDGNKYVEEKTKQSIKEYICSYLWEEGIICGSVNIELAVTDTETVIGDIVVSV
ncbi:MAG: hypothetical protein J6Q24_00430, partial [Clostridia bacterium]|nr:hypothetical protein [Clostridia bacterium]